MIVVDTSALFAVMHDEDRAPEIARILGSQQEVVIASANLTELFIVSLRRGIYEPAAELVQRSGLIVIAIDEALARASARAYRRWGKGFHPAALNFGDCFAYALAKDRDCPLLFVGNDFARTDVRQVLA